MRLRLKYIIVKQDKELSIPSILSYYLQSKFLNFWMTYSGYNNNINLGTT